MIFVIGGACQGKREFVERMLAPGAGVPEMHCADSGIRWTDGELADWDQFMKAGYCVNFHLLIRRLMKGELGAGCSGLEKDIHDALAENLMRENPHRILVTDEIGYGIVPTDAFERRCREETGRICCQVAREAGQVWRVCCGLGMRIK